MNNNTYKSKHINYKNKYNKYYQRYNLLKNQIGGSFSPEIQNKVLAIGEIHYKTDVTLQDIIRECKVKDEYIYHIFSEMRLEDNIHRDGNVTVIPEMEYIVDNDIENLKCAMFFLVNTFPYMKKVLEVLQFQYNPGMNKYITYEKCLELLPENMDNNISDYFNIALNHRLIRKFFTLNLELYEQLELFYKNYRIETYDKLKIYFDKIIDISIRNRIFEPILELTEEYKQIGKDKVSMINPLIRDYKFKLFDSETKYDGRRWLFGWPFFLRNIYHSNRIEKYIRELSSEIRDKSIYIVHKGNLHFELGKDINPIRYSMKVNFVGNLGEKSLLKDLIRNTRVVEGKLSYP